MKPDDTSRPKKTRGNDPSPSAAWDRAYATQGRLWGGAPLPVPDLPEHSRVLELGCGSGKMTSVLAEKPYDLVALDFSRHACRLAQQALARYTTVDVLAGDARAVPLKTASVDAVVAYHVAGHLLQEDRTILLDEVARVLKPGGRFLFNDFSAEDFRAGQGTEVERSTCLRGSGIITHYFTENEVRSFSGRLILTAIGACRRPMRIRGKDHPRAEILAAFTRK